MGTETNVNYENDSITNDKENKAMMCPICQKVFFDIHSYAEHVSEHSREETKRKAEEEKKRRDSQQKKDAETLIRLNDEFRAAKNKYDTAVAEYRKKYGGLLFPYDKDLGYLFDLLF